LYAALGAKTQQIATEILNKAKDEGITFAQTTLDLVNLSAYMPHLASVGSYPNQWDAKAVERRSTRLLELAWDRLYAWLT
jgi:hypothetical protein